MMVFVYCYVLLLFYCIQVVDSFLFNSVALRRCDNFKLLTQKESLIVFNDISAKVDGIKEQKEQEQNNTGKNIEERSKDEVPVSELENNDDEETYQKALNIDYLDLIEVAETGIWIFMFTHRCIYKDMYLYTPLYLYTDDAIAGAIKQMLDSGVPTDTGPDPVVVFQNMMKERKDMKKNNATKLSAPLDAKSMLESLFPSPPQRDPFDEVKKYM